MIRNNKKIIRKIIKKLLELVLYIVEQKKTGHATNKTNDQRS